MDGPCKATLAPSVASKPQPSDPSPRLQTEKRLASEPPAREPFEPQTLKP